MIKFEKNDTYISKCTSNLWEEYKVLDRTPCFVTTDHGKFRVNEFDRDTGDTVEYFIDKRGRDETIILASDTYDAVSMDGIKKARERMEISGDWDSQIRA